MPFCPLNPKMGTHEGNFPIVCKKTAEQEFYRDRRCKLRRGATLTSDREFVVVFLVRSRRLNEQISRVAHQMRPPLIFGAPLVLSLNSPADNLA